MELVSRAVGFILKGTSDITDLIPANLIFFGQVPQRTDSAKYIRFYIMNAEPHASKEGQALIDTYYVEVEIYVIDPSIGSAVARQIRNHMDRYPSGMVNAIYIDDIIFLDGEMLPDKADELDHTLFRLRFECRIRRSRVEPAPLFTGNYSTSEQSTGTTWENDQERKVQTFVFDPAVNEMEFTGIPQDVYIVAAEIVDERTAGGYAVSADISQITWDVDHWEWVRSPIGFEKTWVTLWWVAT